MSDNVTLLQLRTKCRRRSNMETSDQANAFITDAELTDMLNASLRAVYELLVEARGAGFYRSEYSFNTAAGTRTYALPGAFMQLLKVSVIPTSQDAYDIVECTEAEATDLEAITGNRPVRYMLHNANLAFYPTPDAVIPMRLTYVPAFTSLSADGDTFDGVNGFEEAAVWRTVAEMLSKDQADVGFAMAKVAEWDLRISKMAQARNAGAPPRVARVYRTRWGLR